MRLVKELEPKLSLPARGEFRQIHPQWQQHRDRDCNWERDLFAAGSAAPMLHGHCLAARTNEQIERLKLPVCEGAGMTAPCEASRKY